MVVARTKADTGILPDMSDAHLKLETLAQMGGGAPWQLALAHDLPHHLFIWVTRGQGRLLLDGGLRGIGPHNAVFIPAGRLQVSLLIFIYPIIFNPK